VGKIKLAFSYGVANSAASSNTTTITTTLTGSYALYALSIENHSPWESAWYSSGGPQMPAVSQKEGLGLHGPSLGRRQGPPKWMA